MKLVIICLMAIPACATMPVDTKKADVLKCVREMKGDDNIQDVFEVCRQIYGLHKVVERN